ncbi:MAG: transglutaminase family protein [Acetobacteraceae bacterium]|nr:transglutaminase family protein [Acetobacteraceae bacterium]
MRIAITHTTTYRSTGASRAIQALRLTPPAGPSQAVLSWQVRTQGAGAPLRYTDAFGNAVELVASQGPVTDVEIVAEGVVETTETAGVVGHTGEAMAPAVCLRQTRLTEPDDAIRTFAESCRRHGILASLHAILDGLHEQVAYDTTATTSETTAAAAFAARRGVCQDHAHIFIAAARTLGIPARYVTGYMLTDGGESVAHHAWAEALAPDLGWIGFDPANGQCPTDRYIRLAIGLDAIEAAPVRGMRLGGASEQMEVVVSVAQQGQSQSQSQKQQ